MEFAPGLHFGVVGFDYILLGVLDREGVGPGAFRGVEDVAFALLFAVREDGGGEGVFRPPHPSAPAVVDSHRVARGGDDVAAFVQFDEGGAGDQAFDVEGWERDEVVFVVVVDVQDGVADLADVDCCAEGGFLRVVALQSHAVFVVPDAVGGDRWVVAHLLAHQLRRADIVVPFP